MYGLYKICTPFCFSHFAPKIFPSVAPLVLAEIESGRAQKIGEKVCSKECGIRGLEDS